MMREMTYLRHCALLVIIILIFSFIINGATNEAFASESSLDEMLNEEGSYIFDLADVFSQSQKDIINEKCKRIANEKDVDVVIFVFRGADISYATTTGPGSADLAAQALMDTRTVSTQGSMIICIDTTSRNSSVYSFSQNMDERYMFEDKAVDYLKNEIDKLILQNEYNAACVNVLDLIYKNVDKGSYYNPGSIIYKWSFAIVLGFTVALTVLFIALVCHSNKITTDRKTYIRNPNRAIISKRDDYISSRSTRARINRRMRRYW